MNKYYSILGIGLLSSIALTSCNKDAIDNASDSNNQYNEIHDYTVNATIGNVDSKSSRANIGEDGKSFLWNTDDKISIWNGTDASTFTIASQYDDSKYASASVPFYYDGENPWEGVSTVWGVYPELQFPSNEAAAQSTDGQSVTVEGNKFTFKLNKDITLGDETADNKPHLKNTMYMLGKGDVTSSDISNIQFEHLTSMFQFELNNFREEQITLKSLKIKTSEAVFSQTLNVTDGVKSYSDMTNTITVAFGESGVTLNANAEISRFINLFPTTNMTADTEITFTAVYNTTTSGSGRDIEQELKVGKIGDLYNGQPLATTDGYQYLAGKRYIINLRPELPEGERGYTETEEGKFTVSTGTGLHNLLRYETDAISSESIEISLAGNIDMNGIDFTPIESFNGVFDGKGHSISNLTLDRTNNQNAMFIENNGTIKNLTLTGVTLTANVSNSLSNYNVNGILASTNNGVIENVNAGGTITSNGTYEGKIGGLVGTNSKEGKILNSKVTTGTTITNGADSKANVGGLVCLNNGEIKGCAVESGVIIKHYGASGITIGGFAGIFQNGKISASSAEAEIQVHTTNNFFVGGFIGDAYQGTLYVEGCYSGGKIKKSVAGTGTVKAGAFICRGTWQWGICKLYISGCYTVTEMKDYSDGITGLAIANGFICTASFVKPETVLEANACYWFNAATKDTQDEVSNAAIDIENVNKTTSADDIKNYMSAMNSVITETGYEYVTGTGSVPLTLQTITPGFGGPDFGEGEELK